MNNITINKAELERYMIGFKKVLLPDGGPLNLNSNRVYRKQEYYKYDVAKEASDRLYSGAWEPEDIGKGGIFDCVEDALSKCNNLVFHMQKVKFRERCLENMIEAESALYSLYCGDDPEKAFEELTRVFGQKYDLISFLYFIFSK